MKRKRMDFGKPGDPSGCYMPREWWRPDAPEPTPQQASMGGSEQKDATPIPLQDEPS